MVSYIEDPILRLSFKTNRLYIYRNAGEFSEIMARKRTVKKHSQATFSRPKTAYRRFSL